MKPSFLLLLLLFTTCRAVSQHSPEKPRARALGVPFAGITGQYNAITDVPGVQVGYKTIIKGAGKLEVGKGPVRTGVTVILPKGKSNEGVPAAWFSLNGDGEMTGLPYIQDYGMTYGPIGITNTYSVGVVRDAIGEWNFKNFSTGELYDFSFGLPVVGETFDGMLNDINGFHVKKEDVWEALEGAKSGPIAEGNVGGGAGMALFLFKGGSGTSSRLVKIGAGTYTVGAFIQGNFGARKDLIIAGVPVGDEINDLRPIINTREKDGSIIVIIATDAPLLPIQLEQLAKRVSIGIARTGGLGRNSSGDIFLAFSTASPEEQDGILSWQSISKDHLDPLYQATVLATEEAIINALVAAETMEGINGNTFYAIPHQRLQEILQKYRRLNTSEK